MHLFCSVACFYLCPQIFQKNYKILKWREHRSHNFWVSTVYTVLSHGKLLIYTFSFKTHINVANQNVLCSAAVKWSTTLEDSEQETRKTWKSKTQLQSKVGNQGVGLQIHCRGPGSPTQPGADQVGFSGCGFPHGRIPVLHLGTRGENQTLSRKCLQTVFKYRLQSTSLSSLERRW